MHMKKLLKQNRNGQKETCTLLLATQRKGLLVDKLELLGLRKC